MTARGKCANQVQGQDSIGSGRGYLRLSPRLPYQNFFRDCLESYCNKLNCLSVGGKNKILNQ